MPPAFPDRPVEAFLIPRRLLTTRARRGRQSSIPRRPRHVSYHSGPTGIRVASAIGWTGTLACTGQKSPSRRRWHWLVAPLSAQAVGFGPSCRPGWEGELDPDRRDGLKPSRRPGGPALTRPDHRTHTAGPGLTHRFAGLAPDLLVRPGAAYQLTPCGNKGADRGLHRTKLHCRWIRGGQTPTTREMRRADQWMDELGSPSDTPVKRCRFSA